MKICLVNSLYYPLVRGGAEDVVRLLAEELAARGHEVCILTTKKQLTGAWVEMEKTGQITIFRFRGYNLCSFYNLREMGAFLRLIWHIIDTISPLNYLKLRQILKKMQPELIWAHNLKGIGYFTTRLFRRQTGFYWQTIHDVQLYEPSGLLLYKKSARPLYAFGRWVYSRLVKLVLAKPNLLISPSRWLIDFYRRQGLFKKTETIVRLNPLPDWIAATTKQPLIKKDNLQLLYLGQLEEAKGVNFLVKAIQDYNRLSQMPPVFLTLVGRGSLQEKILQISDPYISCQDNVDFEKVPTLIQHYDLLVVPSLCFENSPTVINLSLAVGRPVLASRLGGIPEMIEENKTGWLFTPGDSNGLGVKLRLIHDQDLGRLKITGRSETAAAYLSALGKYLKVNF